MNSVASGRTYSNVEENRRKAYYSSAKAKRRIKANIKVILFVASFIVTNILLFNVGQAEHPETQTIIRFATSLFQSVLIFGIFLFMKSFFKGLKSDY